MSLNVIGLISGGKDSLYNLAHCLQNGHKIVALANLYPLSQHQNDTVEEAESADLNSFMYQTVGHSLVPLYAEALDITLYRCAISGIATQVGRHYNTSNDLVSATQQSNDISVESNDETEDMYILIRAVLASHPEANALSAGAILSTYQRTRVESVAVRLGLTPLTYLWQYPSLPPAPSRPDSLTSLLDDMAAAGCDARIIKIASGGIRSTLLFANVADQVTTTRLVGGLANFFTDEGQEAALRGALLGEGGEYETLALDGPSLLWKKRIQVETVGTFHGEGGTSYVNFGKATVVAKPGKTISSIPVPAPLDVRFQIVLNEVLSHPATSDPSANLKFGSVAPVTTSYTLSPSTLQITNLTTQASEPAFASPFTPASELTHLLTTTLPILLRTISQTHNIAPSRLELQNIVHSTLLLSSMEAFASVNTSYATHLWPIGLPVPPSRVTVAAPLPHGVEVSLSLVFDLGNTVATRKGLHVQSRSYWTPANIGPYSQAVSVALRRSSTPDDLGMVETVGSGEELTGLPTEIVHMAGQIPLVPASMAISEGQFEEQAVLALQHQWRIGQERGVDVWVGAGVAYLASALGSSYDFLDRARAIAAKVWGLAHAVDEKGRSRQISQQDDSEVEGVDETVDVWDLQRNRGFINAAAQMTVGEHLHALPNDDVFGSNRSAMAGYVPPLIAVEVAALPRNASIEWWSTGVAGLVSAVKQDQCRVMTSTERFADWGAADMLLVETRSAENGIGVETHGASAGLRGYTFFIALIVEEGVAADAQFPKSIEDIKMKLLTVMNEHEYASVELVTAQSFINISSAQALDLSQSELVKNSTVVPCCHVWTDLGHSPGNDSMREIAVALLMRVDASSA